MKKIVLNAKPREVGKEEGFDGFIKGVVYGPELKENKLVWVQVQEFKKAYGEAGHSTLVDLKIDGEKEELSVLFHDMQRDALTDDLKHIDFYKVKMGEKIETSIEFNFVGEAPVVKEQGGILVKNMDALEARCFPRHLISEIEVDLGALKEMDDSIRVEDLKIPEEIEAIDNPDSVVVSISKPRTAEELEELDEKVEMDVDDVEVEKGKAEDEEGEGEDEPEEKEKPSEEKPEPAKEEEKK